MTVMLVNDLSLAWFDFISFPPKVSNYRDLSQKKRLKSTLVSLQQDTNSNSWYLNHFAFPSISFFNCLHKVNGQSIRKATHDEAVSRTMLSVFSNTLIVNLKLLKVLIFTTVVSMLCVYWSTGSSSQEGWFRD